MTTPQNNVKSVSVLDLEDFVINLEQAENLLNVYLEFIDDECPAIENKDTRKRALRLRLLCMPHARICFKPS